MKSIINILFALLIVVCATANANAQNKGKAKLGIGYSYGLPMGAFKNDLVNEASPRGFYGDLMFGINQRWSAGLGFGFQDFYQKYPRALYETGNHEVTSAVLSNSIQVVPVVAKGMYMPFGASNTLVQPYVSAGAGLSFINFRQYLGEFGSVSNSASFTVQAGAGIMIPFKKGSPYGFNAGADYNYIPYQKYGYSNMNNLSFRAGLHFPLR